MGGSRVVVLKQLKSGLLLVTGPYSVNGVPLRRMNQRYVIATSTKVNVDKAVAAAAKIDDAYFKREGEEKKNGKAAFLESSKKKTVSAKRKTDQKSVDAGVVTDPITKKYLKAKFALTNNMMAHEVKF